MKHSFSLKKPFLTAQDVEIIKRVNKNTYEVLLKDGFDTRIHVTLPSTQNVRTLLSTLVRNGIIANVIYDDNEENGADNTISFLEDCHVMPSTPEDDLRNALKSKTEFILHWVAELFCKEGLEGTKAELLFLFRTFTKVNINLGHPFDDLVLKICEEIKKRNKEFAVQPQCGHIEYNILNNNQGSNVFNSDVTNPQFLSKGDN